MKKIILTLLLLNIVTLSIAQTGVLMNRYYISGSLSIGQSDRSFADSSAWVQIGGDTTTMGVLFPKVILDSVQTSKRALFVYDLKDSVLYHFDGNASVRYMTYKDTTLINAIVSNSIPDHAGFIKQDGNIYGEPMRIGSNDNQPLDFETVDTVRLRLTKKGNLVIGDTLEDETYKLKVKGAIYSDSLFRMNVHNPVYEDKDAIILKGDFHPVTKFHLGFNNYGSYFKTHSLDIRTGGNENLVLTIGGDAPSAGGIIINGGERRVDFKGGLLGDGWKVFAPEGIWSYQHTSFPFQPIEFTGNTTSQGIKLHGYSGQNALQVFGVSGNIGIGNVTTDNGYKLDVNGSTRITGYLRLNDIIYYDNTANGITIGSSTLSGTGISIGGSNTAYEQGNIKVGYNLKGNNNKQFIINMGYNNDASNSGPYSVISGTNNSIISSDAYVQVIGTSNFINYIPNTVSEGISILGSNNLISHPYCAIIGYKQTTTASNQLIFAQARENGSQCGFNDVYFGTGPRSIQLNKVGSNVTINASGAGDGVDVTGGFLRLAGGKSTGAAISPDLIFATATATTSGSQLQSLSDRWYMKGETGRFSNSVMPTSQIDITTSNGYDQLRLRSSYTPISTSDADGEVGDVAWDDSYIYIKTSIGWKRTALSSF